MKTFHSYVFLVETKLFKAVRFSDTSRTYGYEICYAQQQKFLS